MSLDSLYVGVDKMSAFYDFYRGAFSWLVIGVLLAVYFGVGARGEKEDKKRDNYGLIGMCMGMCIGVSLKGIIGSVGTGISIGMLAGLVIGSLIEKKTRGEVYEK